MTRALVTGIGGQDGHYLAERLLADGVEVHGLSRGPVDALPGVTVHTGDVTDHDGVRRLLLELAPDEVYNLAALSSVARSWEEPELTFAVNGGAVPRLLRACDEVQQRTGRSVRFVQASSAEIFGEPATSPQDEETPLRPVNPYGRAKAFAHEEVGIWRSRGLHASAAILYNHESPRRPTGFVTRRITSTVAAITRGEADWLVLGDLEARRDWGWAPDHVEAMVRAARADQPGDYVVATGESHAVRDFVALAFARAGITDWERYVGTDRALTRPVDATELVGDPGKAGRELGWRPTVGFEELVSRMVDADLAAR